VHHEVKSFESQLKVYQEVTEYAAILDAPMTAALHISRAIEVALKTSRPVYLEIPRDMVFKNITVRSDFRHERLPDDHGAIDEAVAEILERVNAAERPVLIVGYEVHRFQLRDEVIKLAERWNTRSVVVSRSRRVSDAASAVCWDLPRGGVTGAAA
jgi:TPP-dependent 2-oxoacid decarboxylase